MHPIVLTFADLHKAIEVEFTVERKEGKIKLSWTYNAQDKKADNGEYTPALQNEEAMLLDALRSVGRYIIPLSEYTKVTNFANNEFLIQKLSLDLLFRIVEKHEDIISLNEVIEYAYVER